MEFDTKKILEAYKSSYNNSILIGNPNLNENEEDLLQNKATIFNPFHKSKVSNLFIVPHVPTRTIIQPMSEFSSIGYSKKLRFKITPQPNTCCGNINVNINITQFGAGTTNTLNSFGIMGIIQTVRILDSKTNEQLSYDRKTWFMLQRALKDINERTRLNRSTNNKIDPTELVGTGTKYFTEKLYLPWAYQSNDLLPESLLSREFYIEFILVDSAAKFATSDGTVNLPSAITLEKEEYVFDEEEYDEILEKHSDEQLIYIPLEYYNQNSTSLTTNTNTNITLDKHNVKSMYIWFNLTSDDTFDFDNFKDPTTQLLKFYIKSASKSILSYTNTSIPLYRTSRQKYEELTSKDITENIIPLEFSLEVDNFHEMTGRLPLSNFDDPILTVNHTYTTGTNEINVLLLIESFLYFDKGDIRIEKK